MNPITPDTPTSPHQSLSQIKSLLAAHSLHPRHRFGQNFLHDADKMRKIIEAAQLEPGEIVLEVGPGTGALSVRLLAQGVKLIAVEIDRDLELLLQSQLAAPGEATLDPSRVRLVIDDVLDGKHVINPRVYEAINDLNEVDAKPRSGACFKLVANLPYNVASPLIANLLLAPYRNEDETNAPEDGSNKPKAPRMSLAIVLIQREVADRLTASHGGKDYGPLGILVQAMCEVDRVATLPPGCFWPPPKVDSAVVRLRVREQPLTNQPHRLAKLLHTLFSKRRKQIGSILGRNTPLPQGIDANQRPEQLSVEQLCMLAEHLQ